MERLSSYAWPGNVRELENVIERAVALEPTPALLPERLPEALLDRASVGVPGDIPAGFDLDEHVRTLEASYVRRALEQSQGERGAAALLLGLKPRSLRYLIRKHGLDDKS
jgi:DNA-binding NtrC family response regulator